MSGSAAGGPAAGASVVLIEDDQVLARSLSQRLRLEGVTAWWARTAAEGEQLLRRHRPTLVVCDLRLPDGSGEALLARLMPELGGVPVVAVTAYGGLEQAVRLMRLGVDDYLAKPFPVQRLLDRLAAYGTARAPVMAAIEEDASGDPAWRAPPMQALQVALARLAQAEAPVLLQGESGAGKTLAARRLHALGPRAGQPFVTVDCPALPASVTQAELLLFGRGEDTDLQPGLVEQAGAGTLFLDEVADLAPPLQARLLRLIEERRFLRLGGRTPRPMAARLVAATQADLAERVAAGAFRADLLYRLAVVQLAVPPLRDRVEDIEDLAALLLRRAPEGAARRFRADALDAMSRHGWPGNVRELRNRIERAALLAPGPEIGADDLFPDLPAMPAPRLPPPSETGAPASLAEARDAAEREHIRRVLAHCAGRVQEAARALGVSRTTLWERMRRLGIAGR